MFTWLRGLAREEWPTGSRARAMTDLWPLALDVVEQNTGLFSCAFCGAYQGDPHDDEHCARGPFLAASEKGRA